MAFSKCFTSIHCVDGTCPSAQYESICSKYGYNLASDMGLKMIKCSKCAYNTQQCTDCIFENTSDCYKREDKEKATPDFIALCKNPDLPISFLDHINNRFTKIK